MPIYEYLCLNCNKPFSFLVGVVADSGEPSCARCGGKKLRKLISRVARVRSKESSLEDLADPSKLGDMDDPKAMARWAKEMGKSMDGGIERQALERIVQEMVKRGRLERPVPVEKVFRDEAVRDAYREVSSRAKLKPAFDTAMAAIEKYGF